MQRRQLLLIWFLLASLASPALLSAEPTTKPTTKLTAKAAAPKKTEFVLLNEQLANPDKAVQDKALDRINELLVGKPDPDTGKPTGKGQVDGTSLRYWVEALTKDNRCDDAESLALTGILQRRYDADRLAALQKARVQAFLRAKKYDAALSAAKGYYNVCPMTASSDAINLLAICLVNAHPDDHEIVRKFKSQQIAASTTQPSLQPGGASMAPDNVLAIISVDAKPYDDQIAKLDFKNFGTLMAKGNLLLLADKPKEARDCFETALDLASEQPQTAAAIGGIARSIRAQSGGIGPANAYILAQRGN